MKKMEIAGVVFSGILIIITLFIAFQAGIQNPANTSPSPEAKPELSPVVIPASTPVISTSRQQTPTPVPAESKLQTPFPVPTDDIMSDRKFVEAAEGCYRNTSVITSVASNLAFTTCMQKTPNPTNECAQDYKRYALEFTNDDDTTSGFERETYNLHLAREYYYSNCNIPIFQLKKM